MIHYGTYRGAVVGLRGAVVGVRGAAVGVRGAAVGNIGIPTYVISRGAVVRQPKRPFFLPKINKVFLRPILQNLKGRSVFDKFFFENDPLDELNQMPCH